MFDVVTFGSATWDIFIRDKKFSLEKENNLFDKKGIRFPLGAKIDIDEIKFSSGGGGTNTAASFSYQGLKTAYCGMLGDDPAGEYILTELKRLKIDTSLIKKSSKKPTNHSIIISIPNKDRTILIYRGASGDLSSKDVDWHKISKAKWIYIAPLSHRNPSLLEGIVNFAHKKKIKVALNPSNAQLSMPQEKMTRILKKTDILFLNQEEASKLARVAHKQEKKIVDKITNYYPGIFVMTKGERGATVVSQASRYDFGIIKGKVVDRTGAGDSFASGFVSGMILKDDIEYAIQLAAANSTSCLSEWGAKNGLLKKNQSFKKIKIKKRDEKISQKSS